MGRVVWPERTADILFPEWMLLHMNPAHSAVNRTWVAIVCREYFLELRDGESHSRPPAHAHYGLSRSQK